jgi:predicted nucleic acid-binding protein
MPDKTFIDTNILLYLLSADAQKADAAEKLVQQGGLISVQVLNELANALRKKLLLSWRETNDILASIRALCSVESLTPETHERGVLLAERYSLNIYDAMIVSSALIAGCSTLYSEDMHDGLLVENQLFIRNPFRDV